MSVIETKELYKIYHDGESEIRAVDGVNISINKGEFTAIVGPSGSGKTTLLNLIGGLDYPTKGEVLVKDNDLGKMSDKERIDFRLNNIGFVFQAYNLIPVLSAEENVGFVMELQGKSAKERHERAVSLLKEVGLEGRENNRPSKLSGGQQQRVAVARALASKPSFVLADEPTANLDSHATSSLLSTMEKLNEKEGMTFVFSTHDPRVMKRARRIIEIEDGKIIRDYTKEVEDQ
ncbi:ABC transporter ATP-binding protein [Halosquirtibacter xylanolyticus]|uniref:ABC transporter ATP-binding protein n=1 Tax=Halosquirtibacter xylanolyticus TaxID=3374599 RepID=UPI003748E997|nr:ABC transporter ATP-binding protein [Prolixibacteraceae bacterium]